VIVLLDCILDDEVANEALYRMRGVAEVLPWLSRHRPHFYALVPFHMPRRFVLALMQALKGTRLVAPPLDSEMRR
jgi:hypothetical protein